MAAFGSSRALRLASFRVLSGLAPSRALRPAPSRALAPSRVLVSCAFLRFASCGPCADVVCVPAPASCVFLRLAPLLCLAAPTSCAFPRSAPSRVLRVPAPCAPTSCAFARPRGRLALSAPRLARSRTLALRLRPSSARPSLGSCGVFGVWGCLRWGCFGLLGWAPSRPPSTQASRADRRRGRQPLGFSCGLRGVAAPATICTPVGGSTADGMTRAWIGGRRFELFC